MMVETFPAARQGTGLFATAKIIPRLVPRHDQRRNKFRVPVTDIMSATMATHTDGIRDQDGEQCGKLGVLSI
jgi:hypothetical protein